LGRLEAEVDGEGLDYGTGDCEGAQEGSQDDADEAVGETEDYGEEGDEAVDYCFCWGVVSLCRIGRWDEVQ
jgi:hypothetical protein